MQDSIEVYGTDTCKDTRAARQHLGELNVEYRYIDIANDDAAAERVKSWNSGAIRTPTIVLNPRNDDCAGPRILSVPSETTLDAELDKAQLLPKSRDGDGSFGIRPSGDGV